MHRLILLCCLALFVFNLGCNQDSAQWKVAAGLNENKKGNPERAIELLETALRIDPESHSIKLKLAGLLAENDQGDLGLMLCDEVLESDPGSKEAWQARSNCLRFLGRFDEALADYQKYCDCNIDKETCELNELAYFRGLAGCELDKALRQINLGIRKYEQDEPWGGFSRNVSLRVRSLVSAGLISRYTDDGHLFVMDLLNELIYDEQQLWLARNADLQHLLGLQELQNQASPNVDADTSQAQEDQAKKASDNLDLVAGNLAILLATRSLIFEDLGKPESADIDRLWLERVGYEPEEIYNALPRDSDCLRAMHAGQTMLDTRGFVLTQMPWVTSWTTPWGGVMRIKGKRSPTNRNYIVERDLSVADTSYGSYRAALMDLDIAVASIEVQRLAFKSSLMNRIEVSLESVRLFNEMEPRTIAVLRHHRRQAHLKAKQPEAAQQDLLRIKELGFEAGPNLF